MRRFPLEMFWSEHVSGAERRLWTEQEVISWTVGAQTDGNMPDPEYICVLLNTLHPHTLFSVSCCPPQYSPIPMSVFSAVLVAFSIHSYQCQNKSSSHDRINLTCQCGMIFELSQWNNRATAVLSDTVCLFVCVSLIPPYRDQTSRFHFLCWSKLTGCWLFNVRINKHMRVVPNCLPEWK